MSSFDEFSNKEELSAAQEIVFDVIKLKQLNNEFIHSLYYHQVSLTAKNHEKVKFPSICISRSNV